MNGAALLQGHCVGGNKGAQKSLEMFWRGVADDLASFGVPQQGVLNQMLGAWNMESSPFAMAADTWSRMFFAVSNQSAQLQPVARFVHQDAGHQNDPCGRCDQVFCLRH